MAAAVKSAGVKGPSPREMPPSRSASASALTLSVSRDMAASTVKTLAGERKLRWSLMNQRPMASVGARPQSWPTVKMPRAASTPRVTSKPGSTSVRGLPGDRTWKRFTCALRMNLRKSSIAPPPRHFLKVE